MTARGTVLKVCMVLVVFRFPGVIYGAENAVSLQDFIRENIFGYARYLSVDEFSDLQMIKDSALYFETCEDTASFEILIKQSTPRYTEYKAKADSLFTERLDSVRDKISFLRKNIPSRSGETVQIEQLESDFEELEQQFAVTGCIPYDNSVLRTVELQYSAALALVSGKNTYTVQEGDCFVGISEKLFGSYKRWKELYEVNREILPVPENPALIYPGLVFKVP